MSWSKGEIVEFAGRKPEQRDLRKIRTRPGQDWEEMYFFRLDWARNAGYPDAELAGGKEIEFEPDHERRRVKKFKPYEGREQGGETTPFLNPYHFIPLAAPAASSLVEADRLLEENVFHDRFLGSFPDSGPPSYSGRVVCRLETEGPVVVGGAQRKPDASGETIVEPFTLPSRRPDGSTENRPAIPGSSLRGLLSSLVEAASCSAMRVLPDQTYTRRAAIGNPPEALSEIGMVVENGGSWKLKPLARSVGEMTTLARKGPADPKDRWRIFVNGYRYDRAAQRLGRSAKSFLEAEQPKSWSASNGEHWYADLRGTTFHWSRDFCTGLDLSEPLLSEAQWQTLEEVDRKCYTRGILLVLGLDGSKPRNLPPTKKHECFLPFEEGKEKAGLLDLPGQVIDQFCTLAESAAALPRGGDADDFPYLPEGRERPLQEGGKARWRPRAGDLVYFERDGQGEVQRIAYSALWRREVSGSLHTSIEQLVSPHLLPFHKGRTHVTLAERLFGFVDGKRALAGRVRFSHALAAGEPRSGWYESEVTLKILAAPKPPSPALYFGQHGHLSKRALDLDRHAPQGRKAYLHHREKDIEDRGYQTKEEARDKAKLKMKVRSLENGTAFYFHVDFHNLTREELGYLLYALRPAPEFRHKLGLGKPLGLGRVRIDPLALCFIDRRACYEARNLFAGKYAGCSAHRQTREWNEWLSLTGALAARYRHEQEIASAVEPARGSWPAIEDLTAEVRALIPPAVRGALELVGNPAAVTLPVTYPVLLGQSQEGEHFRWFVENDRKRDGWEVLRAIEPGRPLPALKRLRPSGER